MKATSVEFLQKKVLKMLPIKQWSPFERTFCNSGQGIKTSKKKDIIKKLLSTSSLYSKNVDCMT